MAGQLLEVEQELAVSQEEEFAPAVENQYVPVEFNVNDGPLDGA